MSIYAVPSTSFQAVLTGAPTGLVGTIGVQVLRGSTGATAISRTTSGIIESPSGSGIYIATVTAPSVVDEYVLIWDTGTITPTTSASEELFVTGTPPTPVTTPTGEQFGLSLAQLRTEVLNHGFDGSIYNSTRLNQYLNDALGELSSKAQYYGEEQLQTLTTVAGTAQYAFPTGMSRLRSVFLSNPNQDLSLTDLRDIDRSAPTQGSPYSYAVSGSGILLYPTPDGAYSLNLRYWRLLSPLVYDTDVPGLPARYHRNLTYYAIARCFEGEDDVQQASYYDGKWQQTIRDVKADLVFPNSDGPRQIRSQWDNGPVKPGWGFWP